MLKAVLFDFDGTLVDSESAYTEVFSKWMWEHGVSFEQQDQVNALIKPGITWGDCLYLMSTVTQEQLDVKKAQADLMQRIEQHIMEVGVPLKEGVRAALEQLSSHYQLAIVSSSPHSVVARTLEHHRLQHYFQKIVALEDVQYPKPHPEPYQLALNQLKLNPTQVVAMEDSLSGAQSAAAAGIFTYVWPDKAFRAEQFANFAKVIYSFEEMLKEILWPLSPSAHIARRTMPSTNW